MRTPRRPLARAVVAVSAIGLLTAGCGLSAEKQPHEISDRAIAGLLLPTTSTTRPASGQSVLYATVYFVNGESLAKVYVPASGRSITADQALTLLLLGPPRNAPKGVGTSIPPGTSLRGASLRGSTLRIDLSGEIKSQGGTAAKVAYAQLVFTALELPGVRSVRFAIQGNDIDAITDDGSLTIIQAKNYKKPLNPL